MKSPVEFDAARLYEFDSVQKKYILNITAKSFKDIYNRWDYSPYKKRDINEALIKYIEDCSEEMPLKHKVSLHLFISADSGDLEKQNELTTALKSYFQYLLFKKINERKKYRINATWYGISGLLLLFLAFFLQKAGGGIPYLSILPEGFYIGGWVLFWEVCSIIFFKSREISQKIKEYSRLAEAEITYQFKKDVLTIPSTENHLKRNSSYFTASK